MITIWRGTHSRSLYDHLRLSWQSKQLTVLVPPLLNNFEFIKYLPQDEVQFLGEWDVLPAIKPIGKTTWPEQPILGVFTSGTLSGSPRLVFYSKQNIEASLSSIRCLFEVDKIKSIFCFPQPTHTFGLLLGYMQSILYGPELIFFEGKYSQRAQDLWFSRVNPNMLTLGAPAHFFDLISKANTKSFSQSYSCISGGAPTSVELWRSMQSVLKIEKPSIGYGATEASPGVTHLPPGREPLQSGEIGYPLKNVQVEIISDKGLRFAGPNLCLAYLENDKLNFPKELILKDLVERRDDSVLVYKGRLEWRLNRGGLKMSLEDIEAVIYEKFKLPSIAVALPHERLGEELGLVLEGQQPNDLVPHLKQHYGVSFDDLKIVEVEKLPVNASFKPDRKLALESLMTQTQLQLPVSVQKLAHWLPHRTPAVWVDHVIWADANAGKCDVVLNKNANYYCNGLIRETSYIEWMAQSFAYTRAYQGLTNLVPQPGKPERAYLVALKDISVTGVRSNFEEGERLIVSVRRTHELGPLSLVEGEVTDSQGLLLAKGQLKLFAQ